MKSALLIALTVSCLMSAMADAQPVADYPARSVRIIMPFPIGSPNDIVTRAVAEQLAQAFKQSVTVENRAGAHGLLGTDYAAKAPADGYTLLVANANSLAAGLILQPRQHALFTDFAAVSLIADATIVLAVHSSVPVESVPALIALARRRSGGLNAALPGMGTIEQLLTALFRHRTGIDIEMVPYKGGGRAVVDIISGQADMSFIALHTVREFIKARRVRALAVASARRSELLPEVPTMSEAGYADVVGAPWNAMLAPAATPREIVIRLNAHVVRIMRAPEMRHYLSEKGANPLWSAPDETHAFIRDEMNKWAKVVREAGVKPE